MQKKLLAGLGLVILLGGCVKRFRPEKIKPIRKNEPVHYRATQKHLEVAIKVLTPEQSYSIFKKDIAHHRIVPLQIQISNMSADQFVFSQDFITGLNIVPIKEIESLLKQSYAPIISSSSACIFGGWLLFSVGTIFFPITALGSGIAIALVSSAVVVGGGFLYYGMLAPIPKAFYTYNANSALCTYIREHGVQDPLLVKACGQSTALLFVRDYPTVFQLGFLNKDAEKVIFDVAL